MSLSENIKNLQICERCDFSAVYKEKKNLLLSTKFDLPNRTFQSIQLRFRAQNLLSEFELQKNFLESINHITVLFEGGSGYLADKNSIQLTKIALSKMMQCTKKGDLVISLDFGYPEDDPIIFFQLDSFVPMSLYIFFDSMPLFDSVQLKLKVCEKNQKIFEEKNLQIKDKSPLLLRPYPFSFLDRVIMKREIREKNEDGSFKTYILADDVSSRKFIKSVTLSISPSDAESIEKIGIFYTRRFFRPRQDPLPDSFDESFVDFVFDQKNKSYSVDSLPPNMEQSNWVLSTSRIESIDRVLLNIQFPDSWEFHDHESTFGRPKSGPKIWLKILGKNHIVDYDLHCEIYNSINYVVFQNNELSSGFLVMNHSGK